MFHKKIRNFILFLMLCTTCVQLTYAQEIRVIDNKGTLKKVNNNQVFEQATDPNPASPATPITVENDIWIDNSTTPNQIKIWDGTTWRLINDNSPHTGTTGELFFADTDGTPTENSHLFWSDTAQKLFIGNRPNNFLTNATKLNVYGATRTQGLTNSDGTNNLPSFRFTDDPDTGMYSPAADELGFSVGTFEALLIDEVTTGNTKVIIKQSLELDGKVLDESNSTGTPGQVLSSTATGTAWIDPNLPIVENKTANYTLTATDNGKIFTFNSAADVTLTVPNGLLVGFNVSVYQTGTGKVIFTGGATILNRLSRFKTAGKDAGVGLVSTATNIFHLTGDLKK